MWILAIELEAWLHGVMLAWLPLSGTLNEHVQLLRYGTWVLLDTDMVVLYPATAM